MPKATATMLIASQRYGGMVLGAFDVINPGRASADGWAEPGPLCLPEGSAFGWKSRPTSRRSSGPTPVWLWPGG